MPETMPRTKAELCEELSLSGKTYRRFLKALGDASEIMLNGEPLKAQMPCSPRYLTDLLDAHVLSSPGSTLKFEFDDFSCFEMEAVSTAGGALGIRHRCGRWEIGGGMTSEQSRQLKANAQDFVDFHEQRKRRRGNA